MQLTENKVLVFGFLNKGNLGDELFKEAFPHIFPELDFTFTDYLTADQINQASAVFLGGGSFLYGPPEGTPEALELLKSKNIFYIGVGVEKEIHPIHQDLMKRAKLVAIRSADQLARVTKINSNTIFIPDLVFSLQNKLNTKVIPNNKTVLLLPNILVVPNYTNPHWMHSAWEYFKSEFAQFLDILIEEKYKLIFYSMCNNPKMTDSWAMYEIINKMKYRDGIIESHLDGSDFEWISSLFLSSGTVITQRFHGIVLAEMTHKPYISLFHHDKLKEIHPSHGEFLSYYGVTKANLLDSFQKTQNIKYSSFLSIDRNIFEDLKGKVLQFFK